MQKNQLRFSIVTPSFNQAQFIRQTIDSVRDQSYPSIEYRVQDGASTDQTPEILHSYGKSLEYKSKIDKGQTDAINIGLHQSSGDIFAYINSDDYYLPNVFEKVSRVFSTHPEVNWVVGDALIVDSKGKEIQGFVRGYKSLIRRLYRPWMLYILNPLPQPSVFIQRRALELVGEFDQNLRYTMDYDMWLRLQQKFGSPYFISEPLSAFRIHGQSKGGSQYPKQFAEELMVVAKYTKNPFLLWLHWLHNQCILAAYSLIK